MFPAIDIWHINSNATLNHIHNAENFGMFKHQTKVDLIQSLIQTPSSIISKWCVV